jgi:hypothetical protein
MIYDAGEPPGLLLSANQNMSTPDTKGSIAVQQILSPLAFGPLNFVGGVEFSGVWPMDMDGDGMSDLVSGFYEILNDGRLEPHFEFRRNLGGHSLLVLHLSHFHRSSDRFRR